VKKTFLILVLLVFATSVFAADWGLWGSLRFATFWVSQDDMGDKDSDTDLRDMGLQDNSRIGANVKVNERFSAYLELAVRGSRYGNVVATRQFFGTYDFGPAKIHIGQMYTPTDVLPFDQVTINDLDLLGWGAFYTGRQEAILLEMSNLRFGIVRPSVPRDEDITFDNFDINLPRLEADYTLKIDPVSARFFGAFQTIQDDNNDIGKNDINSYVVGVEINGRRGIVGFAATGYYGRNTYFMSASGPFDYYDSNASFKKLPTTENEDFEDYGGAAAIMLYPTEKIKLEVGAGYSATDNDMFQKADNQFSVYGNVKYTIAQGFFVQPEVSYYDYLDDIGEEDNGKWKKKDGGSELYFGAKWQMDF
jgi:hypothetical protein